MQRDRAIDVVRGLCIVYMVLAHICYGSFLWRSASFVPWIDGASGFILISGLVLGIISRRRTEGVGMASAELRLMRRTALLYISQVALTVLAVAVALTTNTVDRVLPNVAGFSALRVIGWLVFMEINPRYIDILSMYVALLVFAMIWVPFLQRGWWPIVVASSSALYVVALVTNWGRFPSRPDGWAYFNTAAWQALFGSAFVVGWYWKRFGNRLRSRAALASAVGVGVLVAAVGALAHNVGMKGMLFDKTNCGLGRIALAWAAFIMLYQLMGLVIARKPAVMRPIALVGSRSLACFITLCAIEIFMPLVIGPDRTTPAAQIAAIVTVLAMYPVARARGKAGDVLTRWRRAVMPQRQADTRPTTAAATQKRMPSWPSTAPPADLEDSTS